MIHLIYLHISVNTFITGLYYREIREACDGGSLSNVLTNLLLVLLILIFIGFADVLVVGSFILNIPSNVNQFFSKPWIAFFIKWYSGGYDSMPIEHINNLIAKAKVRIDYAERNGLAENSRAWRLYLYQSKMLISKFDPENKIPANQYGYQEITPADRITND